MEWKSLVLAGALAVPACGGGRPPVPPPPFSYEGYARGKDWGGSPRNGERS